MDNTLFLGVLLDSKLDFKAHASHIRKKVAKGIYVLGRAKKFFDELTIRDLYYAFIHPYLYYCNEVWGNAYGLPVDPLVKLQKRAVRIIAGVSRDYHTHELFQRFKIVPIDKSKLYEYNVYMFIYKLLNNQLLPGIQSSFVFNNHIHDHSTRHSGGIHMHTINCTTRQNAIRHQSAVLYNKRPDINYNVPITSFKFCLKTTLLYSDD